MFIILSVDLKRPRPKRDVVNVKYKLYVLNLVHRLLVSAGPTRWEAGISAELQSDLHIFPSRTALDRDGKWMHQERPFLRRTF